MEAAPFDPAEQTLLGDHDVVEHDLARVDALVAELPELARHGVAEILGHDEQRHAAVARLGVDVGLGEHREAVALVARS